MQENTKKKRKIGALDIIIVLVIIAGLFVAYKVLFDKQGSIVGGGSTPITYTLEMRNKDQAFIDGLKKEPGDKIYDNLKGGLLGTITDIEVVPYEDLSDDKVNGNRVLTKVDGLYTVYITVEADAAVTDGSTSIDGYEMLVGKEVFARSTTFASSTYCVKLDWEGTK